jgi:hypothetical protein
MNFLIQRIFVFIFGHNSREMSFSQFSDNECLHTSHQKNYSLKISAAMFMLQALGTFRLHTAPPSKGPLLFATSFSLNKITGQ